MSKLLRLGAEFVRIVWGYCSNGERRQALRQALEFDEGRRFAADAPPIGRQPAGLSAPPPGALREFFDRRTSGRGIHKWLHYFPAYERHLAKFVGRAVEITEIGIFSGGSLEMWHAYFGDRCSVYGVDIAPETKVYEGPGTRIFIGDQGDRGFWQRFKAEVPSLDILLDDGSHLAEHQILTFQEMFSSLKPGGIYICEDIHGHFNAFAGYLSGVCDGLNAYAPSPIRGSYENGIESPASVVQAMIASVHIYPFMIVIEKSGLPVSKLEAPRHGSEWQPFYR